MKIEIAYKLQQQLDDLDVFGLSEAEAAFVLRQNFPGFKILVAQSARPIVLDMNPERITLFLDGSGNVKAAVHG